MHITFAKRGKVNSCDQVVIGFGFVSDCNWLIDLVTRRFLNQSKSEVAKPRKLAITFDTRLISFSFVFV